MKELERIILEIVDLRELRNFCEYCDEIEIINNKMEKLYYKLLSKYRNKQIDKVSKKLGVSI